MYSAESSAAIFEELKSTINAKGMRGLNNVRMACDFIASARGMMNYSRVGDVTESQFGGPKKQSIQNNANLKRYIAARITEYYRGKDSPRQQSLSKSNEPASWPEENLSSRVKMYISHLRTRLEMVESRYQELRFLQEKLTKADPVSLVEAIDRGNTKGHLTIQYPTNNNDEELKVAIRSLLKLGEYIKTLQTETINSRTGLILKRPSGDVVVLTPSQFEFITKFLG
ncbi:hypothetical protein EC843_10629 [Buttiauxella sp. JUb87]|uniref:hypothetical protein n=1 Tax=Buttiauxella sp. JUb87 TaxID=2485129 RepID=UPI00105E2F1D|nr:hypothetical protein [Buttiauxella sp. JUb87]TDN50112.1 hypothetical protein EC843_10629 [Buttiauxella sp. JUb87]